MQNDHPEGRKDMKRATDKQKYKLYFLIQIRS